jgi:DNA-nicking Smr family endonuclease
MRAAPRGALGVTDDGFEDEVVEVEISDVIDLHSFAPRDIPKVVEAYLEAAAERGYLEVRLIHGKGTGFQRRRVREILTQSPRVLEFFDAPPQRGAWGATIVRLRQSTD